MPREVVEDVGSDAEQLLDRRGAERQQQGLAEPTVVSGHRSRGALLGEPEPQAEEGDVGLLAVRMRTIGLDVGALDEPDVHVSSDEGVDVAG